MPEETSSQDVTPAPKDVARMHDSEIIQWEKAPGPDKAEVDAASKDLEAAMSGITDMTSFDEISPDGEGAGASPAAPAPPAGEAYASAYPPPPVMLAPPTPPAAPAAPPPPKPGQTTSDLLKEGLQQRQQSKQQEQANLEAAAAPPPGETAEAMGPRPPGIQDKHWIPDPANPNQGRVNIAALSQSYNELQRAFSQRQAPAAPVPAAGDPSQYFSDADVSQLNQVSPNMGVSGVNDPVLVSFANAANRLGLSKEQTVSLASEFAREMNPHMPPVVDGAAEIEKLGPQGSNIALANSQRILALHDAGHLSVEEVDALAQIPQTSGVISALDRIFNQMTSMAIPRFESAPRDSVGETLNEWEEKTDELDMSDDAAWKRHLAQGTVLARRQRA